MIERDYSLKELTTFKVPATAAYFARVTRKEELPEIFDFIKNKNLPFFILGGGSNTLFAKPFEGVVIHIAIEGKMYEEGGDKVRVTLGAGENWDSFVEDAVSKNLWGIENLSLIPGSLGGAPIQNIGAYGVEAKETIEHVEVYDSEKGMFRTLSNADCEFGYRTSIFKTEKGKQLVVIGVSFLLKKHGEPNTTYADLAVYFKDRVHTPSLKEMREAVILIRKRKLPDVSEVGTAGSFFKNPIVDEDLYKKLTQKFKDIPGSPMKEGGIKIPAGFLLDVIGHFKGFCVNDACVWDKQALVLVNKGKATAQDVLTLSNLMKEKIKNETEINLEHEVVVV